MLYMVCLQMYSFNVVREPVLGFFCSTLQSLIEASKTQAIRWQVRHQPHPHPQPSILCACSHNGLRVHTVFNNLGKFGENWVAFSRPGKFGENGILATVLESWGVP